MDINITTPTGETARIFLNGNLVAEISAGVADTRDVMSAELRQARASVSAVKIVDTLGETLRLATLREDHVNKTPQKKQAAAIDGIVAGLEGATIPHPTESSLPPIQPRHDASYSAGYEWGDGLRRAIAVATEHEESS